MYLLWNKKRDFMKFHIFTEDHGAQFRNQTTKKMKFKNGTRVFAVSRTDTEELKQQGTCPSQ